MWKEIRPSPRPQEGTPADRSSKRMALGRRPAASRALGNNPWSMSGVVAQRHPALQGSAGASAEASVCPSVGASCDDSAPASVDVSAGPAPSPQATDAQLPATSATARVRNAHHHRKTATTREPGERPYGGAGRTVPAHGAPVCSPSSGRDPCSRGRLLWPARREALAKLESSPAAFSRPLRTARSVGRRKWGGAVRRARGCRRPGQRRAFG